jgi:type IV pilus assembly protein PilB
MKQATTTNNQEQSHAHEGGNTRVRVGDILIDRGLVTEDQLSEALEYQATQGKSQLLGEILVKLGFVAAEQVLEILADAFGVPFAKLTPKLADQSIVEILPSEFLEKHNVLPLFLVNNRLTIAVSEPSNVFLIEEIQRLTKCQVQIVVSSEEDITVMRQNHLPNAHVFVIDELVGDVDVDTLDVVDQGLTDLANIDASAAGESPVIKLVNYIIYSAVQDGASDIHIEPGEKSLRVRYRLDGKLYEKISPPYQLTPAVVSRIKIMGGMDISERRIPQDGAITVMLGKRAIDLRVSTIPTKTSEKVVMRVIDNRGSAVTLEQLGFSHEMLTTWRSIVHQPNGIVLVTGPTGSGKSTTLYATLGELVDETVNISTVEDPVECQMEGVNQFQTNDKAGFTFSSALRALLRQDPDVIMVGEIRDAETGLIATQAALTGHLVVSTLHTNDAPSAITRLFNIGVEPYLVAATVKGVQAQRLLRRICKHCKESVEVSSNIRRTLEVLVPGCEPLETMYEGRGCPKCRNTGYSGRIGIYELFAPDDEMMDAVSRGATLQELRRFACASDRYTTLAQDGLEKVRAGITTITELFQAAAAA